jgi:hypothetical protein
MMSCFLSLCIASYEHSPLTSQVHTADRACDQVVTSRVVRLTGL